MKSPLQKIIDKRVQKELAEIKHREEVEREGMELLRKYFKRLLDKGEVVICE